MSKRQVAYLLMAISLLGMLLSTWRMLDLPLWGHWPLLLGCSLFMLLTSVSLLRGSSPIDLCLTSAFGLLMGLSFPPSYLPMLATVGFIPLLYLIERQLARERKGMIRRIWYYAFLGSLLWNVIATFWVMNTAFVAGVFANVVNAFLMSLPIVGYALVRKYMTERYHWIAFISLWIVFEFGHYHWQLHWPWLTIGNAFASWPSFIQWYDITGVLGGSVWALAINFFGFETLYGKGRDRIWNVVSVFLLILSAIFCVLFYRPNPGPSTGEAKVLLVQPNFEPHYEKFSISASEQRHKIEQMIRSGLAAQPDIRLVVLPETVFRVRLNRLDQDIAIRMLRGIMDDYPSLEVIGGFSAQRILEPEERSDKATRIFERDNGEIIRWEEGNVAIHLTRTSHEIYYKSKLVPGAETFPYYKLLFIFQDMVDQLGGSIHGFRMQEEREIFPTATGDWAPIICYESVFGSYVREYVAKGADAFVIMTNDGWWDHTAGHKQHLAYASLRAIEQRRAIARAANTGISALILPDGSIQQQTGYEEDAAVVIQVPLYDELTTYARWGDIIGRASLFVVLILAMQFLYQIFAKQRNAKINHT